MGGKSEGQPVMGWLGVEPEGCLKERYARGEITEAEYEKMRDDLAV